ncbi:hypothetical protein FTUN_7746 [Frigoriglobus tundricola]|uniref:Uncharacterized protein n=1 Tax=Frigoriglobus tundricola TaxID=2774151 RepID=A0A6M5Z3W2_9BACT|nr:hypothetical protein FTUN_7746 [Frigoriglobus tundricola]
MRPASESIGDSDTPEGMMEPSSSGAVKWVVWGDNSGI